MNEYLISGLKRIIPSERIRCNELMSMHTTFRVGGKASCMVVPETQEEVVHILTYLHKADIPYFLMGNGSNLLVSDKGYDGVIIKIGSKLEQIEVNGCEMRVSAGTSMAKASMEAYHQGLTGLEFASGIPGTVGGGVVMNAGAYGGEIAQVVKEVVVVNEEGEEMTLDLESMEFGYRTSAIKNRKFVVLSVLFQLQRGDKETIGSVMKELAERRKSKQPLEYPSAGSTFKRPEGYFAGKLIEDAGLKGYRVGGASVSTKHSGFIINEDHATAADIHAVIRHVQEKVNEQFHVKLETEVIYLGEFK